MKLETSGISQHGEQNRCEMIIATFVPACHASPRVLFAVYSTMQYIHESRHDAGNLSFSWNTTDVLPILLPESPEGSFGRSRREMEGASAVA
jgi:hypothetical protein